MHALRTTLADLSAVHNAVACHCHLLCPSQPIHRVERPVHFQEAEEREKRERDKRQLLDVYKTDMPILVRPDAWLSCVLIS